MKEGEERDLFNASGFSIGSAEREDSSSCDSSEWVVSSSVGLASFFNRIVGAEGDFFKGNILPNFCCCE